MSAPSRSTSPAAQPAPSDPLQDSKPLLLVSNSSNASSLAGSALLASSGAALRTLHWSVFYPLGIEAQPPCQLHYLYVGCWSTTSCDYFLHRNPAKGEVLGHKVFWLHNAEPRDRFVFVVAPVEERNNRSLWGRLWTFVYGPPPAFALSRAVRNDNRDDSASSEPHTDPSVTPPTSPGLKSTAAPPKSKLGVEVIEVLHSDITALDYCPGMTGSRLAVEAQTVSAHWFPKIENVYTFYKCDRKPSADANLPSNAPSRAASVLSPNLFATNHLATDKVRTPALQPNAVAGGGGGGGGITFSSVSRQAAQGSSPSEPSSPNPLVHSETEVPTDFELPAATASAGMSATREEKSNSRDCNTPRSTTLPPSKVSPRSPAADIVPPEVQARPVDSSGPEPTLVAPITTRHTNTMVVVSTQDPHFNAIFREVLIPEPGTHPYNASIAEQKRLLGLYEAGMPSWTIFISRWGLPYRRRYRLFFVMLINIWPVIALCVGLYDLYKHLPFVKDFLADALSPFSLWVNNHFVVYMSMLVTYIFTVSFSVLQGLYVSVKGAMSVVSFMLYPFVPLFHFILMLRYPLQVLWGLAAMLLAPVLLLGSTLLGLLSSVISVPILIVKTVFVLVGGSSGGATAVTATNLATSAGYFALWWRSWIDFWEKVARPLKNVAKACYDGVIHVGVSLARREASIRRAYTDRVSRWADATQAIFSTLTHSILSYILSVDRVLVMHGIVILLVALVTIYLLWDSLF